MEEDRDPTQAGELSDKNDVAQVKEDAETAAARKELKHTAISEQPVKDLPDADDSSSSSKSPPRSKTPDDTITDALKEVVGSPKKKRAHAEVDADHKDDAVDTSLDGAPSPPLGSRSTRLEPEKKRPRDANSMSGDDESPSIDKKAITSKPISTEPLSAPESGSETDAKNNGKPVTSDETFKKSGFAAISSAQSPFAAASSTGKSVFGGNMSARSPFGASSSATTKSMSLSPPPSLANTSSKSPFGGASNGSTGGSIFGGSQFGAFGSTAGGKALTSFATPGQTALKKDNKPSRDFGAPESEGEEEDDEESSKDKEDDKDESSSAKGKEKATEKEGSQPPTALEDKKKTKLHRVQVDNGEAGEATLLSFRAKVYTLDRATSSWKERGTGTVKVNAPEECVEVDGKGIPIPGSFDASPLEDQGSDGEEHTKSAKGPRLIMRQENTLKVILNTAIVPAMSFKQSDSLKTVSLIFQSFEESGVVTVSIKLNPVNAAALQKEVESIKRELSGAS